MPAFKSFVKLVCISALVFQFAKKLFKKVADKCANQPCVAKLHSYSKKVQEKIVLENSVVFDLLSASEIKESQNIWIRFVQFKAFPEFFLTTLKGRIWHIF